MVENYVEKYLPISIQRQMSKALKNVEINEAKTGVDMDMFYKKFEKKQLESLHKTVLEDNGFPRLNEQMKQMRFEVETLSQMEHPLKT